MKLNAACKKKYVSASIYSRDYWIAIGGNAMTPEQEQRFNQLLAEIRDPYASLEGAIHELEHMIWTLQSQHTISNLRVRQAKVLIQIMQLTLRQQIPANLRLIQALCASEKSSSPAPLAKCA